MSGKNIRIGISRCLMGEAVRYDGGHKLAQRIINAAWPGLCWVPVCPEAECGLKIPREPMRLERGSSSPRLVTIKTRTDLTDMMESWIASKLAELEKNRVSAFILKSRSPSCGICDVPVYNADTGHILSVGPGLFARAFLSRFSGIPISDESNAEKTLGKIKSFFM